MCMCMFFSSFPVQMYRLTWWSRYSQEPRIDLPGPWQTSDPVNLDTSPDSNLLPDSWWQRAALRLCGLIGSSSGSPSPVTENVKLISLQEEPLWGIVCNVNALLLLTINVFLWGYFF